MRKVTTNYGSTEPTAFVTKGRQRVKQYNNDSVYLNNGDEFDLELFNPTTSKVMAKIELNGISIGAGIVLRPGERVFIERYIDDARKFMFQTYEVNGNNKDVQRAIANNGDVRVLFYKESTPVDYYIDNTVWTARWPTWGSWTYPNYIGTPTFGGSNITGSLKDLSSNCFSASVDYGDSMDYSAKMTTQNMSCCDSLSRGIVDLDNSVPISASRTKSRKLSKSLRSAEPIETGRIDKGSVSCQTFGHDYSTFETYWTWQIQWKILPLSQKPVVSEDLKIFCSNCGSRKKRGSHNFCPNCGSKY